MQRRALRAVIMDWSGTLIDKYGIVPTQAFSQTFAKRGLQVSFTEIRKHMGLRKDRHLSAILASPEVYPQFIEQYSREPNGDDIKSMYNEYMTIQKQLIQENTEMIPVSVPAIEYFRRHFGLKIGVTTGYTKELVDIILPIVAKQGFVPDASVAGDEVEKGTRPNPFMLYRALQIMNISPIRTVLKVGDTESDIVEGLASGCWTCGVSRYSVYMDCDNPDKDFEEYWVPLHNKFSREKLQNAGAHYVVDSVANLPAVIMDINERLEKGEQP